MRRALQALSHPWLARVLLACVCLAVLAPTLSRLVQSARGLPVWQVVCRSDGSGQALQFMRVDAAAGGVHSHPQAAHESDCPLCTLQQPDAHVPPGARAALPLMALRHQAPQLYLRSPAPLHAWAAPRSRGPPSQV